MSRNRDVDRDQLFQSEKHPLTDEDPQTVEKVVLHLIHMKAYRTGGELAAGKRVLDLGCNNGYGSRIMAETAADVLGVDVSERAIIEARIGPLPSNLRFECSTGRLLDLADASVDIVTSFQVIEHVPDVGPYLSEIKRVLKDGGLALFTTPNASIRLDPHMKPWNVFHVREYTADELRRELEPHFSNVEIRGLFGEPQLEQVERERVAKLRRRARNPIYRFASDLATTHMSEHARDRIESFVAGLLPHRDRGPSSAARLAREQWNLDSVHYRTDDLDDALDLMAVCSNSSSSSTIGRASAENS
jgi:2-polyprenyl-3-methyl-5-hydroxy-6-metoxy-1,4-benzoquinol methylase